MYEQVVFLSNSGLRNCHLPIQTVDAVRSGKTEQVHLTCHLGNPTFTLSAFFVLSGDLSPARILKRLGLQWLDNKVTQKTFL